jgi:uncharacterized DUF497 family protein
LGSSPKGEKMTVERYTENELDNAHFMENYDIEKPDISVDIFTTLDNVSFVWDRQKSNENISNHGFSHYLTRHFYNDKFRVINGQKSGKDIVDISADAGNTGMLCGFTITYIEDDLSEKVVFLIRQETLDDGKIRLITCCPTENEQYMRWYFKAFFYGQTPGTKRHNTFPKNPHPSEQALKEHQRAKIVGIKVIDEIVEELVEKSIKAKTKFERLITTRPLLAESNKGFVELGMDL